jgi:hypothetical protein
MPVTAKGVKLATANFVAGAVKLKATTDMIPPAKERHIKLFITVPPLGARIVYRTLFNIVKTVMYSTDSVS